MKTQNKKLTISYDINLTNGARGRKEISLDIPEEKPVFVSGRIPRVTRMMALAIHFEKLIKDKVVSDYAEIAHLGHVSRARMTQIMNFRLLAPDIQEAILNLPRVERGLDPIRERMIRELVQLADWKEQREVWHKIAQT